MLGNSDLDIEKAAHVLFRGDARTTEVVSALKTIQVAASRLSAPEALYQKLHCFFPLVLELIETAKGETLLEAIVTLGGLVKGLGQFFLEGGLSALDQLLNLLSSSDPRMADEADNCLNALVKHVKDWRNIDFLIEFFLSSRNSYARFRISVYINFIIQKYPVSTINEALINISSKVHAYFQAALQDSNKNIQQNSVKGFLLFRNDFPKEGHEIYKQLRKKGKKKIDQCAPKMNGVLLLKSRRSLSETLISHEEIENIIRTQLHTVEDASCSSYSADNLKERSDAQKIKFLNEAKIDVEKLAGSFQISNIVKILIHDLTATMNEINDQILDVLIGIIQTSPQEMADNLDEILAKIIMLLEENDCSQDSSLNIALRLIISMYIEQQPYSVIHSVLTASKAEFIQEYYEFISECLNDHVIQVCASSQGCFRDIVNCVRRNLGSSYESISKKILEKISKYFISTRDLEYALDLIENETNREISELLMDSLISLSMTSINEQSQDKTLLDTPVSYFVFKNHSYIHQRIEKPKGLGDISIILWFHPVSELETMQIIELQSTDGDSLEITLRNSEDIVILGKSEHHINKIVKFKAWNSLIVSIRHSTKVGILKLKTKSELLIAINSTLFNTEIKEFYLKEFKIGSSSRNQSRHFNGLISCISLYTQAFQVAKSSYYLYEELPGDESFQQSFKLKIQSPHFMSITPCSLSVDTNCRRVIGSSILQALRAIGGLGRLLPTILLADASITIKAISIISLLSESPQFPTLLSPEFFQHLAASLAQVHFQPRADFVLMLEILLKNLSSNRVLTNELVDNLLFNKALWKAQDKETTSIYIDILLQHIHLTRRNSLYLLFDLVTTIINVESEVNLMQIADLLNKIFENNIDDVEFAEKMYSLLFHMSKNRRFHSLYQAVLSKLLQSNMKFSFKLKKNLVNLIANCSGEYGIVSVMKLLGIGSSDMRIPSEQLKYEELVADVDQKLPMESLYPTVFTFLFAVFCTERSLKILSIITSRIYMVNKISGYLGMIEEATRTDKKLAKVMIRSDYFPDWIFKVYIKHYAHSEQNVLLVLGITANCLAIKKCTMNEISKFNRFFNLIAERDKTLIFTTLFSFYQYICTKSRINFNENCGLLLALLGVFEDYVSMPYSKELLQLISEYSALVSLMTDLVTHANFQHCSYPVTPHIPLSFLLTSARTHCEIDSKQLYLKEGGFIRVILSLNLIGLCYEQSEKFIHNIKLVLSASKEDDLFLHITENNYCHNHHRSREEFIGFSSLYDLDPGEDLFFNHRTISIYLITESIEILMTYLDMNPHSGFKNVPLAEFIRKLLIEYDIKTDITSKLIEESSMSEFLSLIHFDYGFPSTLPISNHRVRDIISKRKRLIGNNISSSEFYRELQRNLLEFSNLLHNSLNDTNKLMHTLLEAEGHLYIQKIHMVFLATISGRVRSLLILFKENCNKRHEQPIINEIKETHIEEPPFLTTDQQERTLRSSHANHSLKHYLKILSSHRTLAPFSQRTQIRNIFDLTGKRFLIKRARSRPQSNFQKPSPDVLTVDLHRSHTTYPSSSGTTEMFLSPKVKSEFILEFKPNHFLCERIKVEGNYLGHIYVKSHFIIFKSEGEATITDHSILVKAPDAARLSVEQENIYSTYEIQKISQKKYLHQSSGIEITFKSGRSVFFNLFNEHSRHSFLSLIPACKLEVPDVKLTELSSRQWQDGQISTFEYLMKLNSYASRSLHNLSQYPVFPWVFSDYTQEELDLNSPAIYRVLKSPIGAQTEDSKETLKQRFEQFADDEFSRFHHGSFYSNGAITLHYLLRLEPFTQEGKNLQGGKHDQADRLFISLAAAWRSTQSQVGDSKELVPELFYFPELFVCKENEGFGVTQTGETVCEVLSPPWARSYFDFIVKHSCGLESKYVKDNIRHWIDLVFGYKQLGVSAEKSVNLFPSFMYSCNYEDLLRMNPEDLESLMVKLFNFGQVPTQLFSKAHPKYPKPALEPAELRSKCIKTTEGEIVGLYCLEETLYAVSMKNRSVFINKIAFSSAENIEYKCCPYKLEGILLYRPVLSFCHYLRPHISSQSALDALFTPSAAHYSLWGKNLLISCCHSDNSFKVHKLNGTLLRSVSYHSSHVTALTTTQNLLFTGSLDSSVFSWKLSTATVLKCKAVYLGHSAPISQLAAIEKSCLLASLSNSNTVLVHETRSAECLYSYDTWCGSCLLPTAFNFFLCYNSSSLFSFTANGYEETVALPVEVVSLSLFSSTSMLLLTRKGLHVSSLFSSTSSKLVTSATQINSGLFFAPCKLICYSTIKFCIPRNK